MDVAWRVNIADPQWVPPLRRDLRELLDRGRHPFHQHAEVAYFLAERGADAVGRVAAIVNHRHNEFHGERTGFFGFFEAENDREVAAGLLDAACEWLARRGMERVLGPANFSTNEECGLLVDGFDTPPAIMMTHNPRYYPELVEAEAFCKAKDLLAYWLYDTGVPQRLVQGVERIRERAGVTIRSLDMKRFRDEVAAVKEVYNSAWSGNWGFVPMTDAEFEFMARKLKPVVDPDVCFLAEAGGEVAGFSLSLPDFNRALKHVNGRLFPLGLFRLLWESRRIRTLRIVTLGLKPGYRRLGIDAAFYLRTWQDGVAKGYREGEASWILEDNWEMRRALEKMGGRVYKTYRMYERPL
ncbi:MAG: N-acetyltransferase [Gemmatimonadetes bacterium]|nr:N-acetyltransferase [Gemmatimonadota bacterium]